MVVVVVAVVVAPGVVAIEEDPFARYESSAVDESEKPDFSWSAFLSHLSHQLPLTVPLVRVSSAAGKRCTQSPSTDTRDRVATSCTAPVSTNPRIQFHHP